MGELIPLAGILVGGLLLFPIVVGSVIRGLKLTRNAQLQRDPEIARLDAELQQAREELKLLKERQQFVEALLEKRNDPTALQR